MQRAGASLTLSWVQLQQVLLFTPGAPSGRMSLPLLARAYDTSLGTLHVEHSVISVLCPMLKQWMQHYSNEGLLPGISGSMEVVRGRLAA
jgi:hypothetical protein